MRGEDADAGRLTCDIVRAYSEACGTESELNCGAKFDAWCDANDRAINSAAFRRARAACLNDAHCDSDTRSDCEYRSYASATPTSTQRAVVEAYCKACAPTDLAGCSQRATVYDPTKGLGSLEDIFVAAWELNDEVVNAIMARCLGTTAGADGGAADAGEDAATDGGDAGAPQVDYAACAKAFGSCAADVYLERVPDCPGD